MPTRELRAYTTMTAGTKASIFCGIAPHHLTTICVFRTRLFCCCVHIHYSVEARFLLYMSGFTCASHNCSEVRRPPDPDAYRRWLNVSLIMSAGKYLFALCEGNFCVGGKRGKKAGNGRLIISQLEMDADDNTICK